MGKSLEEGRRRGVPGSAGSPLGSEFSNEYIPNIKLPCMPAGVQ